MDRRRVAQIRSLLCSCALALVVAVAFGCGYSYTQSGAEQTEHGSPAEPAAMERTFDWTDTTRGLHLFVYGVGLAGRLGEHLTEAQVRETARRFDVALWLYSDTGVSGVLKDENPDFLTFLYYDAIFAGLYQVHEGVYWMPEEDWEHVSAHPDMFAKNCDWSQEPDCRIRNPIWTDEWLMDISDIDPQDPDSRDHWVNFFVETTRERIRSDGYMDGLFIDELMLPYTIIMPENMPTFDAWFEHLLAMAEFTRARHKDIPIVFNGLQQNFLFYPRMTELLEYADGALFECFVLCWFAGPYLGEVIWERTMELALWLERRGRAQFLQAIWDGTPDDLTKSLRLLALASYYLVKGRATYFYVNILGMQDSPVYLPEWDVDLGAPLDGVSWLADVQTADGYYRRDYENGAVLVNPSADRAFYVELDGEYRRVLPRGACRIGASGGVEGDCTLEFETVDSLVLEPASGEILVRTD